MVHISNIQVVKASKLIESINLSPVKEYDLTEVFVDSKDSENSGNNSQIRPMADRKVIDSGSIQQIKTSKDGYDIVDKLYMPYIGNKLT